MFLEKITLKIKLAKIQIIKLKDRYEISSTLKYFVESQIKDYCN